MLTALNVKMDVVISKVESLPIHMDRNLLTMLNVELSGQILMFREAFEVLLIFEKKILLFLSYA